jgi:AraC-like DNA-binding protein
MTPYKLTSSWLVPLVRAVQTYGIDPNDLLAGELQSYDLNDPANIIISHDSITRLWKRAAVMTREPAIGIVAASFITPNTFGPLSFAMYASDCASTALRTFARFSQVGSNAAIWWFRQNDQYVELTQQMRGEAGGEEMKDAIAAAMLNMCRSLGNPNLRFEKLVLGRPPPKDTIKWRKAFSIEPEFRKGGRTLLRFSLEPAKKRCPSYEPELFELCLSLLERKWKDMSTSSFYALVKAHIIEGLEQGEINIDIVAGKMGISRRTLQRRLWSESQCTYGNLYQAIRDSLAKRYLVTTNRSIEEISDLLGYSCVSNFSRSFKKSFEMTPTEFRRVTGDNEIEMFEALGGGGPHSVSEA